MVYISVFDEEQTKKKKESNKKNNRTHNTRHRAHCTCTHTHPDRTSIGKPACIEPNTRLKSGQCSKKVATRSSSNMWGGGIDICTHRYFVAIILCDKPWPIVFRNRAHHFIVVAQQCWYNSFGLGSVHCCYHVNYSKMPTNIYSTYCQRFLIIDYYYLFCILKNFCILKLHVLKFILLFF